MKLIHILTLSSVALAKPKPGFISNIFEKGWEANKQELANAINDSGDIGALVDQMSEIEVQTIEKPAHELMQKGMDWIGDIYQQNSPEVQEAINNGLTQLSGVDTKKLAVKLMNFYETDGITTKNMVEETIAKLMKELMPTLILKLLRNSFDYMNIDGEGAVVPADVETRLTGLYLEYFCESDKTHLDEKIMKSLRGSSSNLYIKQEEVLTWAESLTAGSCSAIYSKLAYHNWHLITDAANQSIKEVDIDWDHEFNYDEFKLFQYVNEINMSVGGNGNHADGKITTNYCSEPMCYPTDFEDSFCEGFNERNRNFSSTDSDALRVIMVVDQSGSMHSLKSQVIKSFNWFLGKQRAMELDGENQRPQFTLSKFASSQKVDSWNNIQQAHRLNRVSYRPGGGTRLFDSLECIYRQFGHEENNILLVITDGEDNGSSMNSFAVSQTLAKLIKEKKWVANFIGANQDAEKVGGELGISKDNCFTFDFSDTGMDDMFQDLNGRLSQQRIDQFMQSVAGEV